MSSAFLGVCASDWRQHFAGRQFPCVECADPVVLPARVTDTIHIQACPSCGCHYTIPLRGSGVLGGMEAISFYSATSYGDIARDDFLARLQFFSLVVNPDMDLAPDDGGQHSAHFHADWGDWHLHW